MDSLKEIDSLDNAMRVEKSNVMMRYQRARSISSALRALEVCVALALVFCSSTQFQNAIGLAGEHFLKLASRLLNSRAVVFLIGNVIVLLLYLLSRRSRDGELDCGDTTRGDLYDEYNSFHGRDARAVIRSDSADDDGETQPSPCVDKWMVEMVSVDAKAKCDEIATAILEAKKKIRRFERTQSAKLKVDLRVKHRPELRRSETETRRRIVPSGEDEEEEETVTSSSETWKCLSNEEFRRSIDVSIQQLRAVSRRSVINIK